MDKSRIEGLDNDSSLPILELSSYKIYKNFACFFKPLRLSCVLLGLVQEGEAKVKINDKTHHLYPLMDVLIMPNMTFEILSHSPEFKLDMVLISIDFFHDVSVRINATDMGKIIHAHPYQFEVEEAYIFNEFYRSMARLSTQTEHLYRLPLAYNYFQNYLFNFAYGLFQKKLFSYLTFSNGDAIFNKFIQLVKADIKSHYSVQDYANRLCISPSYLSRVCKKTVGISPKNVINNQVLSEAKHLLVSTTASIQEVANKLNFLDQSTFSRFFKQRLGLSPTAFREKMH